MIRWIALATMTLVCLSCESGIHFSEGARPAIEAPVVHTPTQQGHGYLALELVWRSIIEGECLHIGRGATDPETRALMTRTERSLTRVNLESLESPVHRLTYWLNAHNFAVLWALETQEGVSGRIDLTEGGFALLRTPTLAFGGIELAPDWIAHGIIRGQFDHIGTADADETTRIFMREEHARIAGLIDGRVLLALACGARSCPQAESYRPDALEQQLEDRARSFLADRNIGSAPDGISALFHWYPQDFEGDGGIGSFIARYGSGEPVNLLGMLPFDWSVPQHDPSNDRCSAKDVESELNSEAEESAAPVNPSQSEDAECETGQTQPCGPSARIGRCLPGLETCVDGQWGTCEGAVNATDEKCNGLDDDCDGAFDEEVQAEPSDACPGVIGVCTATQSLCRRGEWTCQFPPDYAPTETTCDGLDNDCDGAVDEGVTPPADLASCTGLGVCLSGTAECANGQWGCVYGDTFESEDETRCDGLDNDCDGVADEGVSNCGCAPGDERPCGADVGACTSGIQSCADGAWTPCSGQGPTPELCDDVDNDCNGAIDDGVVNACGTCGPAPTETCNGEDDDCDRRTDEGVLNACGSCGALAVETCNAVDDDCDGQIDEGLRNACGGCGALGEETCDGLDNDCDGEVDEELTAPADLDCPRLGVCANGSGARCLGAEGFGCGTSGLYEANETSCDFQDNDCDGHIDEGLLNRCQFCGSDPTEGCNHLDDDCDGIVDEGCPIDPNSRPTRDE